MQISSPCSGPSAARLICALMISMSKLVRFICHPSSHPRLGHLICSAERPCAGSMRFPEEDSSNHSQRCRTRISGDSWSNMAPSPCAWFLIPCIEHMSKKFIVGGRWLCDCLHRNLGGFSVLIREYLAVLAKVKSLALRALGGYCLGPGTKPSSLLEHNRATLPMVIPCGLYELFRIRKNLEFLSTSRFHKCLIFISVKCPRVKSGLCG